MYLSCIMTPITADPKTPEEQSRGGAPKGNRNATRHGLRATNLPKGCIYLQGQLVSFRRIIRNDLVTKYGRTSNYQEAVLQSAVRHETRAVLAARWLRKEAHNLEVDKRLALLREVGNATDSRDKCLRELGLDDDGFDNAIDVLYSDDPHENEEDDEDEND